MDTIVEVALESLSRRVNIGVPGGGKSIADLREKYATIELFKILKRQNIPFNPDEIEEYLISKYNWKQKDANDVSKIASEILSGIRKRSKTSWADNIFNIWEEKAQKLEERQNKNGLYK